MSDHIADRAAFIAALSREDPERKLAEEHAGTCRPCRLALEEGRELLDLLAQALPLPAPTPETLASAAKTIEQEMQSERRLLRWTAAGAVLLGWILQLVIAIGTPVDSAAASIAISVAVVAIAISAAALTGARRQLAVAVLVGTSGLLVFVATRIPGLEPKFGIHCTMYELAAAAIPWLVATSVARRGGMTLDRYGTSALAAGGALASQAAQHLSCPVAHADAHLLVFHLGGVVLAAILGALIPVGRARFVLRPPHAAGPM